MGGPGFGATKVLNALGSYTTTLGSHEVEITYTGPLLIDDLVVSAEVVSPAVCGSSYASPWFVPSVALVVLPFLTLVLSTLLLTMTRRTDPEDEG
jgi:hypothetical protein